MHTNHTSNYELSQFIGTDKPTFLGDYNGDMLKIDTAIAGVGVTATAADTKADNAITAAGNAASTASDAATLANTANTNANSALATAGNAATAASAAGTAASAADTKATAANTAIGDLTQLTTTAKTDLVAAVNEVNAKPSGGGTAASTTYDNTTSGLTATDVQAAIDEINAREDEHDLGTGVSLITYTTFANAYTFTADGYVMVYGEGASAERALIYGANATADTAAHATVSSVSGNSQSIYVKKGMKAYVAHQGGGNGVTYIPLQ